MKYLSACVLLFAFLCACPATALSSGIEDIVPISSEKEKRIGMSVAKQVEEQYDGTDDPLVQKRFEEIGKRLASVCDRQDLIYHFKVLKAKEGEKKENYYNAFALPGGYVYIFEPMMELMETDGKIAAIAAHEIGHICARHSVKRIQGSLGINALMILAVASGQKSTDVADVNEAVSQLMMAYSRKDELEADRLSVTYMKKAGFDPEGVLECMRTLRQVRKEGRERVFTYYNTHPYLSERTAKAKALVQGYTDFDSFINVPERKEIF